MRLNDFCDISYVPNATANLQRTCGASLLKRSKRNKEIGLTQFYNIKTLQQAKYTTWSLSKKYSIATLPIVFYKEVLTDIEEQTNLHALQENLSLNMTRNEQLVVF